MRTGTDLLGLACTLHDPLLGLVPGLVECKETSLASSLDEQLIDLCNELGAEYPSRELGVGGDGVGDGIPGDLHDLGRRIDELCLDHPAIQQGGGCVSFKEFRGGTSIDDR